MKQRKPWFDKKCLSVLDQKKQAKMQWVQEPSHSNLDNLDNARREVCKHFRNKRKEYLKAEIEEFATSSKKKTLGTCIGTSLTLRKVISLESL